MSAPHRSQQTRVEAFARNLRRTERHYERVLALCPMAMWPWLRTAFQSAGGDSEDELEESFLESPFTAQIDEQTLLFFLAELPYATA